MNSLFIYLIIYLLVEFYVERNLKHYIVQVSLSIDYRAVDGGI
jgi:hypothetical protein